MTEKRFNLVKCTENRWGIEDNTFEEEDKLFFICREGQFETNGLVLLLNQLNDENEQLKEALIELKEIGDYQYARIKELSDENEQLEKILNELSDMLQFDVENGIRSYPVKLSEYLSNALKEL